MVDDYKSILDFWFGKKQTALQINADKIALWWQKSETTDQLIKTKFESMTTSGYAKKLDHWQHSAEGLLALIITQDQFPRNIYRGLPDAFKYDAYARQLANKMLRTEQDMLILPIQRLFAYLPLEHSESLRDQERSVALFDALKKQAADDEKEIFDSYYGFAVRHYDIIEKFGRFPHRNKILGRVSTQTEITFLAQPGSSF